MKKIVLTGPESTGKSTLSLQLADHFNTAVVPEFARNYIDDLERAYVESDLLEIAKGQLQLEQEQLLKAKQIMICDTDLITIKIWSEYKYGRCDPQIINWIETMDYDHYLLCGTDIDWKVDPQRENPNDRDFLYESYKKELLSYKKPFTEISGNQTQRLKEAIAITNLLLKK